MCMLVCVSTRDEYCVCDFRTGGLVLLLLLEAIMGWNFVSYLLSRREDATDEPQPAKVKQPGRKNKETKNSEKKKN